MEEPNEPGSESSPLSPIPYAKQHRYFLIGFMAVGVIGILFLLFFIYLPRPEKANGIPPTVASAALPVTAATPGPLLLSTGAKVPAAPLPPIPLQDENAFFPVQSLYFTSQKSMPRDESVLQAKTQHYDTTT